MSWDAQYVLVRDVKHAPAIAALEAGIPDIGALIFAALGIALALQGRRAIRPRALNVTCIAISLAMNALASAPGWRDLAIWIMPSAVYALASDTLIGVIRAWAIARMQHRRPGPRRRRAHPHRPHRRVPALAAAPGPRPALHDRGIPPLDRRGMPHRPRPQSTTPTHSNSAPRHPPAAAPAAAHRQKPDQAGPHARAGRPATRPDQAPPQAGLRHREHDRRRGRPVPRHRPARPAAHVRALQNGHPHPGPASTQEASK